MNLQPVKMSLQRMMCPEHHEHPEVKVVGDQIEIKCCCEKFKAELVRQSESLIAKSVKDDLEKRLKSIFK